MESCGSPLTLGTRQVFSATRQVVLLAFINQVLNIVCYPAFISPALKGWIRKHLAHCWAVTLWNMCKSDQELRGSTQKPCRSCPVLTILRPLRNLLASAGNHYSGLFMYCCFWACSELIFWPMLEAHWPPPGRSGWTLHAWLCGFSMA